MIISIENIIEGIIIGLVVIAISFISRKLYKWIKKNKQTKKEKKEKIKKKNSNRWVMDNKGARTY